MSRNVSQNKKLAKITHNAINPHSNSQQNRVPNTTFEESAVDRSDEGGVTFVPLKKCILTMLDDQEFSDVILCIGGKEIYAHRAVLCSRSTYFQAMFSHEFKETDKSKIVLKGVNSYELFYNLLEFMY